MQENECNLCFLHMEILEEKLQLGNFRLNFSTRKVFIEDCELRLRNKEFSLLCYFLQNVGRVLSRTQLLEEIWDRNICWATNTVDVHVSNLRRIFKKHNEREFIRTVHCIGYVFEI